MNKQVKKHAAGKCIFSPQYCDSEEYVILDVHRIKPGSKGGKYTDANSVVCCSNCHRKIHAGDIDVDRYYSSTGGRVLRVVIDGKEDFLSSGE